MPELKSEKRTAELTVAISTLDRPDALAACLQALEAGTVLPGEIVVVDQSPGGRTRQVVERVQPGLTRMVYVRHAGRGLGAAQNIAIARASTPVVAVTDDDCLPAPDWVARIEAALTPGRPGAEPIAGVTGRVLPLGPDAPGQYPVATRTSRTPAEFGRQALPWEVGSGNNFAVRRDWLLAVGGNDVRLGPGSPGLGGVDMDLFYRLLRAGARLRYDPAVLVYHARASREGRLSRRFPYGYGLGAACSFWLRQKDRRALLILARWALMRLRRLARGLLQGDPLLAREEALVLAGTLRGVVHGLTSPQIHPLKGRDLTLPKSLL